MTCVEFFIDSEVYLVDLFKTKKKTKKRRATRAYEKKTKKSSQRYEN